MYYPLEKVSHPLSWPNAWLYCDWCVLQSSAFYGKTTVFEKLWPALYYDRGFFSNFTFTFEKPSFFAYVNQLLIENQDFYLSFFISWEIMVENQDSYFDTLFLHLRHFSWTKRSSFEELLVWYYKNTTITIPKKEATRKVKF